MKKIIAWLLTIVAVLTSMNAFAESLPIEGKVVSTQSYPIISQAKGAVEDIGFSVGDRVVANDCIVTISTTKVYAPVSGKVFLWGEAGDSINDLKDQFGAVAYIEPSSPYTITTNPVDPSGRPVTVHPGQKVYLICVTDGKKTGEGVITSASASEYTVRVESSNFEASDKISIYTTPDHKTSNRIGRGFLKRIDNVSCLGNGYVVKTHVKTGAMVKKGDLLYETIEGSFQPGMNLLDQVLVPENGVIESICVNRGQEINEKTEVAILYPDSNLRVQAMVPEYALRDYRVGDTVYIISQNGDSGQQPVVGKIEKVSQIPEKSDLPYDVFYSAYITVSDHNALYYGMNVTISKQNPTQDYQNAE